MHKSCVGKIKGCAKEWFGTHVQSHYEVDTLKNENVDLDG
jgi:hypothetical protein